MPFLRKQNGFKHSNRTGKYTLKCRISLFMKRTSFSRQTTKNDSPGALSFAQSRSFLESILPMPLQIKPFLLGKDAWYGVVIANFYTFFPQKNKEGQLTEEPSFPNREPQERKARSYQAESVTLLQYNNIDLPSKLQPQFAWPRGKTPCERRTQNGDWGQVLLCMTRPSSEDMLRQPRPPGK